MTWCPPVSDLAPLYPVCRTHLRVMTDDVGIFQHASGSRPDPDHGYCVDDVARAVQVDLLHGRQLGWVAVSESAWRGSRFLAEAFDPASGRFRNFRSIDRSWIGGIGSEDSHARAVLALSDIVASAPDPALVEPAMTLLVQALPAAEDFVFPRAWASVALGCSLLPDAALRGAPAITFERLWARLDGLFRSGMTTAWRWPEDVLTYENALLPRALIAAGDRLGRTDSVEMGLLSLDWLIEQQTTTDGHLSPIGNGWWPKDGQRSRLDQQPIEATALLLAAHTAWQVTGSAALLTAMERSYAWYFGANDLGIRVADPERGACHDGLTPRGVNLNQGAESTLMWLMAAEHIRAVRDIDPMAVVAVGPGRVRTDDVVATAELATPGR